MLSDLFINGCVLISTIFILLEAFKNELLAPKFTLKKKIIFGLCAGILSSILMVYRINVTSDVFFDFRHISQSVSATFGGPISSIITAFITTTFHVIQHGVDYSSVMTILSILLSSLLCSVISILNVSKFLKWIYMILSTTIVRSILLYIVLDISEAIYVIKTISFLWLGSSVFSIIVYLLLSYLEVARTQTEVLKKEANIDFLTGLKNPRSFNKLLEDIFISSKKSNQSFSILMIDIDYFKQVNDTYGHAAGDDVLRQVALILETISSNEHIVGRVGGEEFCVILKNTSNDDALRFAKRLRSIIENYSFTLHFGIEIRVTVSIGVASYSNNFSNVCELKEMADIKLYEAKNTGRNKVCSF